MRGDKNSTYSHLLLQLTKKTYAINVSKVSQIYEMPEVMKMSQTPLYMSGMMSTRGSLTPVIDLHIFYTEPLLVYNMKIAERTKQTAVIRVKCGFETDKGAEFQDVDLLVDGVTEVVDIDITTVERPILRGMTDTYTSFLGFVRANGNIAKFIDFNKLLNKDSMEQLRMHVPEMSSV
jgi:chemotaxis signal transduction protein